MKQFFSAVGRLVRQFPRTHLLLAMVLLGGVIIIALQPEPAPAPQRATKAIELPARPAAKPVEQPAPPQGPQWQTLTVKAGDSLSSLLQPLGVGAGQVYALINSDEKLERLTKLRPGEQLEVLVNDDDALRGVRYNPSKVETLTAKLTGAGWTARLSQREYQKQTRFAQAEITDSLFLAGAAAGISDRLTMQLAELFAWDIDFVLDIRKGDKFRVLYEELYLDGEKVGEGDILMAEFWNQDRHLSAFRYETLSGDVEYLDIKGDSMRKAFIRTPVAFARISSRFNLSRKHPVLNRIRAHKGTDYAAPSGTPIRAAGDGKVIFAGVKGGYGNVIILKHGQIYTTLYAHMRSFAKGIRVGKRVKQSQTIGYVGSSGLATGPHLHYEFRINGVHRNPQTVPLPKARGINDNERAEFLIAANRLKAQMTLFAEAATLASSDVF
ncbi:peptidoglycan DD-metalloendopeptidase family protein [Alcanivorax sp. DP30]|uniref:peptidoglycan DD-metalloendopeptidase family protein n=1 Tax=Alcanivorax sp. DP30 TaxID=2606217 RepID=UPI001368B88C|nr:peptidoglycan DD-metalloendopeptidase family protein [Alcanivorax sp. DP30]MZR64366.1 peptidoglycan DD-metalloendopeptidase family protein [Alcanivorax sp. DP30]